MRNWRWLLASHNLRQLEELPRRATVHPADPVPGTSRCFPFWQELLACYVVNTTADDDSGKKKCQPVMEDYYECLHHKKEASGPQTGWSAADQVRRPRGPWRCSTRTARPRPPTLEKTRRSRAVYGSWGCWAERRRRARCWVRSELRRRTSGAAMLYICLSFSSRLQRVCTAEDLIHVRSDI